MVIATAQQKVIVRIGHGDCSAHVRWLCWNRVLVPFSFNSVTRDLISFSVAVSCHNSTFLMFLFRIVQMFSKSNSYNASQKVSFLSSYIRLRSKPF